MRDALASVDSVSGVEIDFEEKTASVTTDGDASTDEMIQALRDEGFDGTVVSG